MLLNPNEHKKRIVDVKLKLHKVELFIFQVRTARVRENTANRNNLPKDYWLCSLLLIV